MNASISCEFFQTTKQKFRISLIPARFYPVYWWLNVGVNTQNKQIVAGELISGSYVTLGEFHTLYYSNWKNCGNSIVTITPPFAPNNNFQDTQYCAYNKETETIVEDATRANQWLNGWLGATDYYDWQWIDWTLLLNY